MEDLVMSCQYITLWIWIKKPVSYYRQIAPRMYNALTSRPAIIVKIVNEIKKKREEQ